MNIDVGQHNIRLHSHQTSISDNFLEKQKSVKFKRAFWFLLKFASKLGVYTVKFLDATGKRMLLGLIPIFNVFDFVLVVHTL